MLYIIKNPEEFPTSLLKSFYFNQAKFKLHHPNWGSAEINMDNYLRKNYKVGLKETCFKILRNCTLSNSSLTEACLYITDPELDKLASLITYGNTEIAGSKILRNALGTYNI